MGQTRREFGVRLKEHMNDLNKLELDEKTKPVAKHLTGPGHTKNITQITCFILDFIKAPGNSDKGQIERDRKERTWISRLGTIRPFGMNKLEPKSFI